MARTTDRQIISEALRLSDGRWHADRSYDWRGHPLLTLTDGSSELNITYSPKGQITHLAHWAEVPGTNGCASRTPIQKDKRAYVLKLIEQKEVAIS